MSWPDVRHGYMEQDDPEAAAEPIGGLPDISPEEAAWLDAMEAEGRRIASELAATEATPDVTRCAWCCRPLPPDPSGDPYPTCDLCRQETKSPE